MRIAAALLGILLATAAQAEPQPVRTPVASVAKEPFAAGSDAVVQRLQKTPRLNLDLVTLGSLSELPGPAAGRSLTFVVVSGAIKVTEAGSSRDLPVGSTLHLSGPWPDGARLMAGEGASVLSIDAPAAPSDPQAAGAPFGATGWTVGADQPRAFSPPGHANTVNRVLFEDAAIRIERGTIGVGGSADRHSHKVMEQVGFVLQPGPAALLYMPPGTPHGGEVRKTPLDLIVIYSPPKDE